MAPASAGGSSSRSAPSGGAVTARATSASASEVTTTPPRTRAYIGASYNANGARAGRLQWRPDERNRLRSRDGRGARAQRLRPRDVRDAAPAPAREGAQP